MKFVPKYHHPLLLGPTTTCQATPAAPATASSLRWLRETWRPTLRLAPESAVSRPRNSDQPGGGVGVRWWPFFIGCWAANLIYFPIFDWKTMENPSNYESLNPEDFLASKAAEAKKQAAGWRKGKQECNKQSWKNMSIHIWLLCRWAVYIYIYIYIDVHVCNSMYLHTGKLKWNPDIDHSSMIQRNCRLLMILCAGVFCPYT